MKFLAVVVLIGGFLGQSSCTKQTRAQSTKSASDAEMGEVKEKDILICGKVANSSKEEGIESLSVRGLFRGAPEYEVHIENDAFEFQLPYTIRGKNFMIMYIKKSPENSNRKIYLIQGQFLAEDSLSILIDKESRDIYITGGFQNGIRDLYYSNKKSLAERKTDLSKKEKEGSIDVETYRKERKLVDEDLKNMKIQFIADYPYSWHALDLLEGLVKTNLGIMWKDEPKKQSELEAYKKIFFTLDKPIQEKGYLLLESIKNTQARKVPSFTGEMPDGKTFDLASFEGKVVLIDFWGSWCGPCRKGHPHMKELYAKYKDKGFEIIAIGVESGGNREEQWNKFKTAIAEDDIPWPQILMDPAKRNLVDAYGVSYFPSKFLVDRDGRLILKTDGDTEERLLDTKLEEVFGND